MAADANHGLPLAMILLPANRSNSPELPVVTDKARGLHPWLRPQAVIADREYDGQANFRHIMDAGAVPVILTRRMPGGRLRGGVYDHQGVPTCVGMVPMEYVRSDPERGHLFRCVGCHLADRPGHANCRDEVWEHPSHNLRLGGAVRIGSAEWEELYVKRQAIERTFKSMKQSLRLNRHCYRGQRKVLLHCLFSALLYQATALAHAEAGRGGAAAVDGGAGGLAAVGAATYRLRGGLAHQPATRCLNSAMRSPSRRSTALTGPPLGNWMSSASMAMTGGQGPALIGASWMWKTRSFPDSGMDPPLWLAALVRVVVVTLDGA